MVCKCFIYGLRLQDFVRFNGPPEVYDMEVLARCCENFDEGNVYGKIFIYIIHLLVVL